MTSKGDSWSALSDSTSLEVNPFAALNSIEAQRLSAASKPRRSNASAVTASPVVANNDAQKSSDLGKYRRPRKVSWEREQEARAAFEKHTKQTFHKVRPRFLKNPETGRNLELDGYCKDLCLAWEADGEQHTEFPNAFHRTVEHFQAQQRRDAIKNELCKQAGIALVRIPHSVPIDQICGYVQEQLAKWNEQCGR